MFARPADDEILLVFTPVTTSPELLLSLRDLLSLDEQERASRFHFDEHRNRFIVGRALLRMILGTCIGAEPASLEFEYGPQGKPSLAGEERVSFNYSGSNDSAMYAVGVGSDLGVDLEHIRPLDDMTQIAERFFSAAEHRELLALPECDRAKAFFDCWTRKEAFVKAVGEGLSHPLDRFQVTLRPGQAAEFVSIDGQAGNETEWALHDVAPPSGDYAAALAVRNKSTRLRAFIFKSAIECLAQCRSI
jgi:4'-phosphopantetheinyl transferase